MPRAPKKCARCDTRVVGKPYCDKCQPVGWSSGGDSRTSTTQHKAWRKAVLARDRGQCQLRGPRCTGRATEADHKINVKSRPDLEFDVDNGQAVCTTCHKTKTQVEAAQGRRRSIGRG